MTAFELAYRATVPMLSPLHSVVRRHLRHAVGSVRPGSGGPVELLDVGGRKSHYTIGLPAMGVLGSGLASSIGTENTLGGGARRTLPDVHGLWSERSS